MKHKEKRKEKKVKQVDDVTRLFIERERDRQTDRLTHTRARVERDPEREIYQIAAMWRQIQKKSGNSKK